MKILSIPGSPNKSGNTATVLGWLEDELKSMGHNTERANIIDYQINGCLGCFKCSETTGKPGCIQNDDGNMILEKMISADAIVISSPLYIWSFSAQIKALLDRTVSLISGYMSPEHKSLIENKRAALLVTCAGPVENNADTIQTEFKRWANLTKTNIEKRITIVPFCSTPENLSDAAREQIRYLADNLVN
ncbi:flavodoxin family protein [bacterium]|nr:flavodoxin family protein [bacterium]